MAVRITRKDKSAGELRQEAARCRDGKAARRMLAKLACGLVCCPAVLHQSPDKRGVPLPVKMVSQLTQTWHSQVRSFC